jgi:aspartyl-tRNA(Asn)/glutamyl-tRNA(Gln) amidotransferase subunit C
MFNDVPLVTIIVPASDDSGLHGGSAHASFLTCLIRRRNQTEVYPIMKISRAQVEHVSQLARLALTDAELDALQSEMDAILDYVEQLNQLNTEGIEPTSHAVPMANAFRDDEVRQSFAVEEALRNAPSPTPGGFRVPRVIE